MLAERASYPSGMTGSNRALIMLADAAPELLEWAS